MTLYNLADKRSTNTRYQISECRNLDLGNSQNPKFYIFVKQFNKVCSLHILEQDGAIIINLSKYAFGRSKPISRLIHGIIHHKLRSIIKGSNEYYS
jgi:hypothetical protein